MYYFYLPDLNSCPLSTENPSLQEQPRMWGYGYIVHALVGYVWADQRLKPGLLKQASRVPTAVLKGKNIQFFSPQH